MLTRNRLLTLAALLIAVGAVFFKVPLASSQGLTITVAAAEGDLRAIGPDAELWQQATAVEVPLSAQMIARPMQPQTNTRAVTVRGLHNGEELALLVEWADPTRNESTLRPEDFRDGVAVQFPLAEIQPFFCMGQIGGDVNIWHWKADWQAIIAAGQDLRATFPNMYVDQYPFTEAGDDVLTAPYAEIDYLTAQAAGNLMAAAEHVSPVENLIAGGFGALTSLPADRQMVQGHGEWRDGVWRVVFARSLAAAEQDNVSLAPGQVQSVAFAAWDGENDERNGTKSTSQWVSLQLAGTGATAGQLAPEATAPRSDGGLSIWAWLAMLVLLTAAVAAAMAYSYVGSKRNAD